MPFFTITKDALDLALNTLSSLPYKDVAPVLQKITGGCQGPHDDRRLGLLNGELGPGAHPDVPEKEPANVGDN